MKAHLVSRDRRSLHINDVNDFNDTNDVNFVSCDRKSLHINDVNAVNDVNLVSRDRKSLHINDINNASDIAYLQNDLSAASPTELDGRNEMLAITSALDETVHDDNTAAQEDVRNDMEKNAAIRSHTNSQINFSERHNSQICRFFQHISFLHGHTAEEQQYFLAITKIFLDWNRSHWTELTKSEQMRKYLNNGFGLCGNFAWCIEPSPVANCQVRAGSDQPVTSRELLNLLWTLAPELDDTTKTRIRNGWMDCFRVLALFQSAAAETWTLKVSFNYVRIKRP